MSLLEKPMESWRMVWRDGFAPQLPSRGLWALLNACETDDPRLTQGSTTTPPPLLCALDWPCEGACAVSYCGWQDGHDRTAVGDVEEFCAKACFEADNLLGEPGACRWFLNWFDDTPRGDMRRELAEEIRAELVRRGE